MKNFNSLQKYAAEEIKRVSVCREENVGMDLANTVSGVRAVVPWLGDGGCHKHCDKTV